MQFLYLLLYLIFISFLGTSKRFGELRSLTLSSSGLWRFASNGPQLRGRVPAGRLCPPGTGPARRNADLDARLGLFPCGPVGGVKVLPYWSWELHQMKGLPQNPSKSLQIYLMVFELIWKMHWNARINTISPRFWFVAVAPCLTFSPLGSYTIYSHENTHKIALLAVGTWLWKGHSP